MPKKITIDDLAAMTKRGFDGLEENLGSRIRESEGRILTTMRDGFQGVQARLDVIRADIADLPQMREELRDLHARVERLEHKVGRGK